MMSLTLYERELKGERKLEGHERKRELSEGETFFRRERLEGKIQEKILSIL